MQPLQNLCPQLVCTGSRRPRRQIGHSYLLSSGGSKNSSYPSDLGSSYDKSSLVNKLTWLGSSETSRAKADCSSARKERVILGRLLTSLSSLRKNERTKVTKGKNPIAENNSLPLRQIWDSNGFRIPDSSTVELRTRIPIVSGFLACAGLLEPYSGL